MQKEHFVYQDETFQVEQRSVLWFHTYCIHIQSQKATLRSNMAPVTIMENGQKLAEITKADNDSSLYTAQISLLPGRHKLQAVYVSEDGGKHQAEDTVSVQHGIGNADFSFKTNKYYIQEKYADATVNLDGKKTGKKVSDYKKNSDFYVINIFDGQKLTITRKFDFGELTSDVMQSSDPTLNFTLPDSVKTDITNAVTDYVKSSVDALVSLDASKLVNCSDDVKKKNKIELDALKSNQITISGGIRTIEYDEDSYTFDKYSDDQSLDIKVKTRETYELTLKRGSASKKTNQTDGNRYTMNYDQSQKKWIVKSGITTGSSTTAFSNGKTVTVNYMK